MSHSVTHVLCYFAGLPELAVVFAEHAKERPGFMKKQSYLQLSQQLASSSDSRLRLQTIVRLRWFAVAGQTVAVLFCHFILGFTLPLGYCLLLIALSAWLNIYLRLRISGRHRLGEANAMMLLGYDIVQLAGLLFLTGGISNPFVVLLVAPVTVSAATLPLHRTVILGVTALSFAALFIVFHMPLPWSGSAPPVLPDRYKLGQFAAVLATMVFLALYVRRLASEARQMSAALSATELVLAREQRLHALDGLAAAAAHELGTPLATIALVAQELNRELPKNGVDIKDLTDDLELLRTQAKRCRDILQKLTRAPSERDPMHARMTIRQVIDEASEPHRNGRVIVEIRPQGNGSTLTGDGNVIPEPEGERQPGIIYGLGNLVENAVDYAKQRVTLSAAWNENSVSVSIIDDGPGFAPGVMDQLGEPYVQSSSAKKLRDAERSGLGLGFFIAKTLLERSGATLEFDNRDAPDHGAVVRVTWSRQDFEQTQLGRV
jgi:two-component system sensor histidine kinase RegB